MDSGKPPKKKQKNKLLRKAFPKVREEHREGRTVYVVDARREGTSGKRKTLKSREAALALAQELGGDFTASGKDGLNFPQELRVMALECKSILAPFGKTIRDATEHYQRHLKHEELISRSRPMAELVDEWLLFKRNDTLKKLSTDTILELEKMGRKLKTTFNGQSIASVTHEQVDAYFRHSPASNQTKKNICVKWGQFFNWAKKRRYTDNNPCALIEIATDGRRIGCYSASEVERMFHLCEARYQDLLPYLAICTFAGVRPSECLKLKWENVHFEADPPSIFVRKSTIAVKDYDRLVPIEPNLLTWLQLCRKDSGPIIFPNHRKRFDSFKIEIGFCLLKKNPDGPKFIPDGLRHTYASYWFALHKNFGALAANMGNSHAMIRNHYNKGVPKAEATKFWEIVPLEMTVKRNEERAQEAAFLESLGETENLDCDPEEGLFSNFHPED